MVMTTVYGYPRIGPGRELKAALERHWKGELDEAGLLERARGIRASNWAAMARAGLTELPCNDFSLYDHVLDMACVLGLVPERFRAGHRSPLARYFAMARGSADQPPLELTKWFDTNYHYLVPELDADQTPAEPWDKPSQEFAEALALGHHTRPVLLGPLSFLLLSKPADEAGPKFDPLVLLEPLLLGYQRVLADLAAAGASWVQLDEPVLVQDRGPAELEAAIMAYDVLSASRERPKILVATYYGHAREILGGLRGSAVDGIGLDLTRDGEANLTELESIGGLPGKRLVAGVVDGRNVWRTDLDRALELLGRVRPLAGELVVAPSCSLLHVPVDVEAEDGIDPARRGWLAFARQKLDEVVTLARGLEHGPDAIGEELARGREIAAQRRAVPRAGQARVPDSRSTPVAARREPQRRRLGLPPLPTTTVGSFPQTPALRAARRSGDHERRVAEEIASVIALQEEFGLDVLVHGEAERTDMVEYFADRLDGCLVTAHGWVQSYGSRCVRPPIIVDDVSRRGPMTVDWLTHAAGLTSRPVKGMLTGPVTMVRWSFTRDDLPEPAVARQVALALREEIADLEAAGMGIIQVDEPAFREGLPLRAEGREEYLAWATRAFRLATGGVRDDTQIQTHMCYSDFSDILDALPGLDADVILVEAARSGMELLAGLVRHGLESSIGPGVYDVHSPRVPEVEEIATLIETALDVIPAERLWVTPDCGLKTRGYAEIVPALRNLVQAARLVRERRGL